MVTTINVTCFGNVDDGEVEEIKTKLKNFKKAHPSLAINFQESKAEEIKVT